MRFALSFAIWAWGALAVASFWWRNRTHFKYTKKDFEKYRRMK